MRPLRSTSPQIVALLLQLRNQGAWPVDYDEMASWVNHDAIFGFANGAKEVFTIIHQDSSLVSGHCSPEIIIKAAAKAATQKQSA